MTLPRTSIATLAARMLAALTLAACAQQNQQQPDTPGRERAPRPTGREISQSDLMTRLYIFADDSMLGRRAGSEGSARANAYIERELRRLGLQPAGENGSFYQDVPLVTRGFDATLKLAIDGGSVLNYGTDFVPSLTRGTPRPVDGAQAIFGGVWGVTGPAGSLTSEQMAGKLVVFLAPPTADRFTTLPRLVGTPYAGAAGIAIANLDQANESNRRLLRLTTTGMRSGSGGVAADTPLPLYVTRAAAEALLGASLDGMAVGTTGRTVRGDVGPTETPLPARNLVAILPGSDPALRGQYVAIGAHNDHVGVRDVAVDHDSLRAFNAEVWRRRGMTAGAPALSAAERATIRVNVDSLRRLRPARRDSINNGADDDGSGSMALLEIAEALVASGTKPRRSVVFVWHTAEEIGLLGARWFTDHPTVARDSIVAQINIDMIGRGAARDTKGGGPNYVGVVGARRLSTHLGDLVEAVNRERGEPLVLDYALDANGHPENIYCRSDHYMYARHGIPIVFFFTGLHEDYHQVTDEPQYIDYPHYTRITQYLHDLTRRVADVPARPVVDKPKPDPAAACRQ